MGPAGLIANRKSGKRDGGLCDGEKLRYGNNVTLRWAETAMDLIASQIFAMALWRKTENCDLRFVMDHSTNICDGSLEEN